MSMVMFVVGCLAVMVGAAMVGYGIPVNEFSFGNTLITAGTTLAAGGLVVVAISAAVSQLQRIAEALAARGLIQPGRPIETSEQPSDAREAPAIGRIPFPPKSAKSPMREPYPAAVPGAAARRHGLATWPAKSAPTNPSRRRCAIRRRRRSPLKTRCRCRQPMDPASSRRVTSRRWMNPGARRRRRTRRQAAISTPCGRPPRPPSRSRGPAAGEPMGEPRPEPSPRDSVARYEPSPSPPARRARPRS